MLHIVDIIAGYIIIPSVDTSILEGGIALYLLSLLTEINKDTTDIQSVIHE